MKLDARHLCILRRLRDLGGWQYADRIASGLSRTYTDGRTVAPLLVALHRADLVACAEGKRRSAHSARTVWTLTADGVEAAS